VLSHGVSEQSQVRPLEAHSLKVPPLGVGYVLDNFAKK
jgi:hypothetical protein